MQYYTIALVMLMQADIDVCEQCAIIIKVLYNQWHFGHIQLS